MLPATLPARRGFFSRQEAILPALLLACCDNNCRLEKGCLALHVFQGVDEGSTKSGAHVPYSEPPHVESKGWKSAIQCCRSWFQFLTNFCQRVAASQATRWMTSDSSQGVAAFGAAMLKKPYQHEKPCRKTEAKAGDWQTGLRWCSGPVRQEVFPLEEIEKCAAIWKLCLTVHGGFPS